MRAHTHTCIECLAAFDCRPPDTHPEACDCVECEEWVWCTGSDGDGRCTVCTRAAFDAIGKHDD